MKICELQTMLQEVGYNESRNRLKALADRGAMDERITRLSAQDVIEKGRLPMWAGYSPESVSFFTDVDSSVTAIRFSRLEIDDALHALAVLAGKYDDSVSCGRETYSVDGVMPPLTSAAHAIRTAAL